MMKRLIVCCDGTWQNLDSPYPTNVVKMAQAIKPTASDGAAQIVYYDEGIGTGGGETDRILGGGTGRGIDINIQEAYRFLCLNYTPGDEIYLFGFSRGAYTVRSLAGLLYNSGLLSCANVRLAPEAYRLYRNLLPPSNPKMIQFRQEYGMEVPITLLACWDTVGSLGIPDIVPWVSFDKKFNEKYRFHSTALSPIVQNALHAVAIDEDREVFSITPMQKSPHNPAQVVRQVWFPGEHGCVGGGTLETKGLSDAALKWMIDSIKDLGLGLDLDPSLITTIKVTPDSFELIDSGINPDYRLDFPKVTKSLIGKLTRKLGKVLRKIDEELDELHDSVAERWRDRTDYRPENLPPKHRSRFEEK